MTISAEALDEIGVIEAGPQPCMTALGDGVDGITTDSDLTFSGNVNLNAVGCSLRSNSGISKNGTVQAGGIYAGGSISSGICCDLHVHSGQIADLYEDYAPLNEAFSLLGGSSGASVTVNDGATVVINPGIFQNWNVGRGTLQLNPDLYVVNGQMSVGSQGNLMGDGVTIIIANAPPVTVTSTITLSAVKITSAVHDAIPGVVIAGTTTDTVTFAEIPIPG